MSHPVSDAGTVLIIPDVHQDIAWVRRVFAAEAQWDRVIFLGDYFDSRQPGRASIGDTCQFLLGVRRQFGDRVTFLLGNHDVQYLEAKRFCDHRRMPHSLKYQCGSAYSHAAAKKVAKGLPVEFWMRTRLFVAVQGHLISHAGVAALHWPRGATVAASLRTLEDRCAAALRGLRGPSNGLLLPGRCRGGEEDIGGITWLDWSIEFDDAATPLPQIVGHTLSLDGPRMKQRSACLDGGQTSYGVLSRGTLRFGRA